MAVELATAYVSIVADTKSLAKSISSGSAGLDSVAEKRGGSIGASLMKGIGGVAVGGAAVVAAGVVGTLGVALTKGFSRLNALDQASSKLRGLGHDAASVDEIMGNALDSVRGTAFGLDEAATTAATAVAAGVKPGADLARYLGIIADTSAIAGADLADVGRVMNNVTTLGAAYNDSLQILAQKGLPIYTWLAEEAGTTEGAIKELASQGEISSEQLLAAVEKNVGGAALAMGETFQGAFANMQASLGRIGAGLLGGVFDKLAPALTGVTAAMAPLEDSAARFGETLGEIITLVQVGFTGNLMEEDSFLPLDVVKRAMGFGEVLKTIFDAMRNIDFAPFLELAGYLSPIGLAFKVLQPILPLVMDSFMQIATVIGGALGQVLTALMPIMSELVMLLAGAIAEILPAILPLITSLAGVFAEVLVAILPLLPAIMEIVRNLLPPLVWLFQALAPVITKIVEVVAALLIPIIEALVGYLSGLITFLTGVFTGDWEKAWEGISQMFTSVWEGLGDFFTSLINSWIDLINDFLGGLNEAGNFLADITGGAIDINVPKIPHLAEGATVLPRRGGTLAVLAEAGRAESVVDTGLLNRALEQGIQGSSGGGSGAQVVVYPQPGMSEVTVGNIAAERLDRALRGY